MCKSSNYGGISKFPAFFTQNRLFLRMNFVKKGHVSVISSQRMPKRSTNETNALL